MNANGCIGGLRNLAEMAAEMATKHAKGLNLWLRVAETRTLRAAFLRCFGCGEFHESSKWVAEKLAFYLKAL
jgi:hypothetical protein